MKKMSFQLSKAVASGRAGNAAPENREVVLERLLRKRAAAHRAGLEDQEKMLRNQIIWSLPVISPPDRTASIAEREIDRLLDCAIHCREAERAGADARTAAGLLMLADECETEAIEIAMQQSAFPA
jgi:hypothetical protein